jgi:DNA/RNA endonuclease YhcR with UshA esterase domain
MTARGVRAWAFGLAALAGSLAIQMPAQAHHSFAAAYNMEKPLEITGTIANVRLTNPHSHFFIDVTGEDGTVVQWKIEAGTPSGMIRNGYSTDKIKTGDTVTIKGFHARDGSANGMLTELILSDGTSYGMFGPRQGPGA